MPEFVKRRVWSPAGIRLALGTTVCPRSAKNSRKRRRISAAGSGFAGEAASGGVDIRLMVPNGAHRTAPGRRRVQADPAARAAFAPAGRLSDGTACRRAAEPAIIAPTNAPMTRPRRKTARRSSAAAARGPGHRPPPLELPGPTGRVGPRIETSTTRPMPAHAPTDAATRRKSPIRAGRCRGAPPSASPAQAPRIARISTNGSRAPADPGHEDGEGRSRRRRRGAARTSDGPISTPRLRGRRRAQRLRRPGRAIRPPPRTTSGSSAS